MIAKSRKFAMRTEFYSFRKEAQVFRSREYTIFFRKSSRLPKVGIVISKKSSPQAVDRNHLKRVLFELVYKASCNSQLDIVVVVGRYSTIEELVSSLLSRLQSL